MAEEDNWKSQYKRNMWTMDNGHIDEVKRKCQNVVEIMKLKNLEPSYRRKRLSSGLIMIMEWDEWEIAREFLKHLNGDSFILNTYIHFVTPLVYAITKRRIDFVELLISHGADVNWASDNPRDSSDLPLHHACKLGDEEVVRILLMAGADVNKRNFKNETAICVAVKTNKPALVTQLLLNGSALEVTMPQEHCPLHTACCYLNGKGMQRMVLTLLRHGGMTTAQDTRHSRALHLASFHEDKDTAKMLVECGATLGSRTLSSMKHDRAERTKTDVDFYNWLEAQLSAPSSLKCLCALTIRMHLVETHKWSILEHLTKLPLPTSLIKYLTMDRYIQQASLTI